jgi:hypothetical protein
MSNPLNESFDTVGGFQLNFSITGDMGTVSILDKNREIAEVFSAMYFFCSI